ncbi:MAG: 3-isopropylmalate dehydratase [Candidatus Methanomethylicota archaeon]|jgi:3-isopropylmalate/(R)-2-methylmalate dehydratase small subunit|uniref:3-isopropylmalate dehydratase small subunit n=1 Tax=Thermoproteota archaeon TaxID=2056631 RepID=A0A523BHW5_9CREN|nr:MAG: 3-isopropylmalate dehydratase small subunit [Candidatus Verstraetearchaeota archaeon]TDA40521.1 MAG: 3-isopropylmalate dehydratase [Candidatus Verstraetearchaeota archaeon]
MIFKGRVWLFGDNIDTDLIIPGKYLVITDPKELAKHVFENIIESFYTKVKPGDIIVAGKNFGCGSSREHAPLAIKAAGISAVIAKSFARIFFRNAINIGLPVIISDKARDVIKENEVILIDLENGYIERENGERLMIEKYPKFLLEILKDGGLLQTLKRKFGSDND